MEEWLARVKTGTVCDTTTLVVSLSFWQYVTPRSINVSAFSFMADFPS